MYTVEDIYQFLQESMKRFEVYPLGLISNLSILKYRVNDGEICYFFKGYKDAEWLNVRSRDSNIGIDWAIAQEMKLVIDQVVKELKKGEVEGAEAKSLQMKPQATLTMIFDHYTGVFNRTLVLHLDENLGEVEEIGQCHIASKLTTDTKDSPTITVYHGNEGHDRRLFIISDEVSVSVTSHLRGDVATMVPEDYAHVQKARHAAMQAYEETFRRVMKEG